MSVADAAVIEWGVSLVAGAGIDWGAAVGRRDGGDPARRPAVPIRNHETLPRVVAP